MNKEQSQNPYDGRYSQGSEAGYIFPSSATAVYQETLPYYSNPNQYHYFNNPSVRTHSEAPSTPNAGHFHAVPSIWNPITVNNLSGGNLYTPTSDTPHPNRSSEETRHCFLRDKVSQPLLVNSELTDYAGNTEGNQAPARGSNYVYQVLMESYEGEFQIASYDFEQIGNNFDTLLKTKKTTYFSKSKVSKLIINHEFRRTNNHSINPTRLEQLARWTAEVFPTCLPESFYSLSTKTKSAGGAFQVYYIKQREKEFAIGRLKQTTGKRKLSDLEKKFSDVFRELQTIVDEIDETYINKWLDTAFDERIIFYKTSDIGKIFAELPNLTNQYGEKLIQADFCKKFCKPIDTFTVNWPVQAEKVINVAGQKIDVNLKKILKENSPFLNNKHKETVALIIIPFLFRKVTKLTSRSKSKTNWVPEKSEILKTFIFHSKKETAEDCLKEAQDELLNIYGQHELMIKPYVVIKGQNLSQIESAYVVLEKHNYQTDTVFSAVDLCFQIHKIFEEKYSIACNHVWQLIGRQVYNFESEQLISMTTNVLEQLQKC